VTDPGRKAVLKRIAEQFEPVLGDSSRGYDAKVLVAEKAPLVRDAASAIPES